MRRKGRRYLQCSTFTLLKNIDLKEAVPDTCGCSLEWEERRVLNVRKPDTEARCVTHRGGYKKFLVAGKQTVE